MKNTEPELTEPEVTEPEVTEPEVTEPAVTEPAVTEPETTESVVSDSFFYFYDYENGTYIYSDVSTYQAVTGAECVASSLDFAFLNGDYTYVVEGYDDIYGVFLYEYNEEQFNSYTAYLTSIGYTFVEEEQYSQGTSYYYKNETNGYMFDLFLGANGLYLAIEPYLNGGMQ